MFGCEEQDQLWQQLEQSAITMQPSLLGGLLGSSEQEPVPSDGQIDSKWLWLIGAVAVGYLIGRGKR